MLRTDEISLVFITTLELTLSVFGAGVSKQVYEEASMLANLDTSDTPLSTAPGVMNIGECARMYFEEPLCAYQRLFERTCSLYRSTPRTTEHLQGATYFTKYGDECPLSKGYRSVHVPHLCFKLSSDRREWSEAQDQCQHEGGRLIILNTAEKQDFIMHYITERDVPTAFVGMKVIDGTLKWIDGTNDVHQWDEGEPDNLSFQQCGSLYRTGMNDVGCVYPGRYICEILTSK